jgi:hypothetical protein
MILLTIWKKFDIRLGCSPVIYSPNCSVQLIMLYNWE